jgi:hypothetical protein
VYDRWGVGQPYKNLASWQSRLEAPQLRMRTVSTIKNTLLRMIRQFTAPLFLAFSYMGWSQRSGFIAALLSGSADGRLFFSSIGWGLGLLASGTFLWSGLSAIRLGRAVLSEQPLDTILLDVGKALVVGLCNAKLIDRRVLPESVWVERQSDGACRVSLENGSPQDITIFTQAYHEIFAPLRNQRYLILRRTLLNPESLLDAARGLLGQSGSRLRYFPVPAVFGRREQIEPYLRAWRSYVGDAELIFTRSETGRKALLEGRARQSSPVKGVAFETWR